MINLIKGQRVEIEAGLTRLRVEMGWKVNPNAEPPYDLDASTFLLGSNGQIENEYDLFSMGQATRHRCWTTVENSFMTKKATL